MRHLAEEFSGVLVASLERFLGETFKTHVTDILNQLAAVVNGAMQGVVPPGPGEVTSQIETELLAKRRKLVSVNS